MKSLFIDRIIRRNSKIKADAPRDKQEVAKKKSQIKNEQPKTAVAENVTVAKEARTLPID